MMELIFGLVSFWLAVFILLAGLLYRAGFLKTRLGWASLVLFGLSSVAGYLWVGQPQMVVAHQQEQAFKTSTQTLVDQLAQRLEKQPDDFAGWMMLGESYATLEQWRQAKDSFEKAYQLEQNNVNAMLALAQSLARMEQGFFNLRAQALVATAQRIDPNNAEGLWLSGVVAKQQGDFYQALTFWSQLQLQMNPGDEDWLVIDNLMKELKNQIQ